MYFTKALLIGINYIGTNYTLRGCHNDVDNIKLLLMSNGVQEDNITVLKEPKRLDILRAFVQFVMNTEKGDSLYFHYSGHGMQLNTLVSDQTESDGKDELIIAADLKPIRDNEINRYLLGCLPPDVNLFTIFDCCHSGTMLDLPYIVTVTVTDETSNFKIKKENNTKRPLDEGKIIGLSGSLDVQVSADAYIKNSYQGALTYCFIETINEGEQRYFGPNIDFLEILEKVNQKLKSYGFVNQEPILNLNRLS